MNPKRKSYYNTKWHEFSADVRFRDNFTCLKCGRKEPDVILQTHHKVYKPGLEPWEYPLSDCITLCKGCHSREHGLVEPDSGWTLIAIDDLGEAIGTCERKGCGADIRHEHITYHPKWGYKSVGSTCVEYLTSEDRFLSREVVKIYNKISDFIKDSIWQNGITQKGKHFLFTTHAHHQIRIYGEENKYSFQIGIKRIGEKRFDFEKVTTVKNKNLERAKELAFIVLKGLTTQDEGEKDILRNIYKRIR